MFLKLNCTLSDDAKIVVSNNSASVNQAFVVVDKYLEEKQISIEDNSITFNGESEFIIDNANSNIYVNLENANFPRTISLEEGEVELFVDLQNGLNYVNKNGDKIALKQGVVEKWIFPLKIK